VQKNIHEIPFVNYFTNQTETSYVNRGGVDKKEKRQKERKKKHGQIHRLQKTLESFKENLWLNRKKYAFMPFLLGCARSSTMRCL